MSSHAFKRPAVSNRLLLVFTTLFLTYLTPVLVAIYQEWTTEVTFGLCMRGLSAESRD